MPKFIQPTVLPNRIIVGQSVKKSGNTAWAKEGMISSDDSCLFEFIDHLVTYDKSLLVIIFETHRKKCCGHQIIESFGTNTLKYGVG